MTVSVRITATGETFEVASGQNIEQLKSSIFEKRGIPTQLQMLTGENGRVLEAIQDGSSVDLSLPLNGGCWCGDDCQCCILPCSIL
ncbi:hypothetical protein PROFUN_15513 [Planoprotostelium fungivorum]|uniref:Ubiquitin-like domain-containing protein n=1 Tax=Planoprotostelium fungivorum TaxID=1890364 RepID=A0A2P6N395_9EUKA|nr:hypothetical protein PROFUN_15513 [Planoprotostelium fungivorum]